MTVADTLLVMIDFQTRLMPAIHQHEAIEQAARVLLEGCRLLAVPVFVTEQYTKGLGATIPELAIQPDREVCFEKLSFSCMKDSQFRSKIEKSGRSRILVAGVESHICVQQTVSDLLAAGYEVWVAADCTGSRKEYSHHLALADMRQSGARITTAEAILFELLESADHPLRKDVSRLVK